MTMLQRTPPQSRPVCSSLRHEVGSELEFDVRSLLHAPRCSLQELFPHREASVALLHSGRAAIWSALRAIISVASKPWRFLLPSYLCPAVLQPFQNLNIGYDFYPVDDHLITDWEQVRRSIHSKSYTGLLFISYFGATRNSAPPDNLFPHKKRPYVIEDLAQAMLSPLAGCRGDYVVYSLRKFFGLPDGGALVARRKAPVPFPSRRTGEFFRLRLRAFRLRELCRNDGLRDRESYLSAFKEAEKYLDRITTAVAMSSFSVQLLERQDLRSVRRRRQENFAFLREHWPRRKKVAPLELSWQSSDIPLGFPVWAPNRDAFQRALIQRGIFPPVHWRLPEAVRVDKRFRASRELSEHVLTIPCDQRYGPEEMNGVIRAVRKILS